MMHRLLLGIVALVTVALSAVTPAAAGSRHVDDTDRIVLRGNVNPHVRTAGHVGHTVSSLPMEKMVLSLRISAGKQVELDRFLAEQQAPASPDFHRWLTPEEFGARFGAAPEDVAAVTGWLSSHGFRIDEVAKGGTWVNFSGTAAQVERAFHTEIHDYRYEGTVRHANDRDPEIPRGLADLVAGPVTLHNFPRKVMNSGLHPLSQERVDPLYTYGSSHFLSPGDFATIYNVNPLYAAGIDGTGQTIAIVGRTNPSTANWSAFRSILQLTPNPPQVIINGPDPGALGGGEDNEADLDVEWSGAVAKNATIKFVTSKSTSTTDGVDLSAQYIVNNNLAPVMSTSFGQCEASMGSAENLFYNNLWAQAAAQGITSFVASGDSGAAACSNASASTGWGLAVSGLSSTPYNVAVGGTQFNDGAGGYWDTVNGAGATSALGYIPEIAWNESGNVSGGYGLWATTGGFSSIYAKPTWQTGPGVPANGYRNIPDVSLSAASHDGYLVYTQGAFYSMAGTSASSPAFAGLMALIVQKTGQRQGNANIRFYQLAGAQYGSAGPAVFHDITVGDNSVPGVSGYSCGPGYDLATGLGSVDAHALVANWSVAANPQLTVSVSPASVSAVQGQSASVEVTTAISGAFSDAVSLSTSGLPPGASASFAPATIASPGAGGSTLTLTVGASTPAATYSVTIMATNGTTTHTAIVSVTVLAKPEFALSASPASISAAQGASASSIISTTVSGGFSNSIILSASGLPTGATAAFSPATIAAPGSGTSVLTLTAGASTPVGTYTVMVTGTGGETTHTATLTFTVSAGSATLFSDDFEAGGWYAAQINGSGGRWSLPTFGNYPTASPRKGSRLADFNSFTAPSGSQTRLYRSTGLVVPSTYAKVTLKFWMYHDSSYVTRNDRIQPQIFAGTAWTNVGSPVARYNGTTGWSQVSIDLSSFKGKKVYIGFVGISGYGNDIYLDDVTVTAQ